VKHRAASLLQQILLVELELVDYIEFDIDQSLQEMSDKGFLTFTE